MAEIGYLKAFQLRIPFHASISMVILLQSDCSWNHAYFTATARKRVQCLCITRKSFSCSCLLIRYNHNR